VLAEVDGRRRAIVADEEESAIQLVDLETHAVVSTTKLDGAPGQILLAPNGTLYVAVRDAARVVALRLGEDGTGREIARSDTPDEPFGLAMTPDGSTVLVSTILEPRLEALRAGDLAPMFGVPLPRDPRSIALTSDGARAFVTHATGSVVSVVEVSGSSPGKARTVALDTRERRRDFGQGQEMKKPMPPTQRRGASLRTFVEPTVQITMKRTATQGFGLAMIGERVFLPETLVMTSDNERIPTGYGSIEQSTLSTHVPFVARVGVSDEAVENPAFSGPADKECFEKTTKCILPRAVADDGKKLYVACLDSDEVLVVDPERDTEHAPACRKMTTDLTRVYVESPSGLAVDAARGSLVIFSTFSRKLTVAPLDGGEAVEMSLPRTAPLPERVVEGRKLFHQSADTRMAKNGRACGSCHVDGRDDGLVWPTPKGKRQTPMLAGRLEGTAPYGWNGEHASLVLHIKDTVKNLEGTGVTAPQLEALAEYVGSMHRPAKRAATSAAIARGKNIFHSSETGCASCHVEATRFTDQETHALGSSKQTLFDTPSLAFVGQTAPYFHDGRFQTLEALLDGCEEPGTMMGRTKHLDPDDRRALASYLRSL
jgi:mono/diheme cytochrome c family protein